MKPLEGVRVLSLAEQYPGPYATLVLSDLGADVVMVERPGGDPSRSDAGFFAALNRNKRSVRLDLKIAAQRDTLLTLAGRCDVFLEGFRPGVAKRLGVDYDAIAALHARVVYLSISAFGQTGPYRDRPAHDLSLQALAGMLHGREAAAVEEPYIAWGDLASGTFAALGALAGLYARERSGRGMYVDVSMADTLLSWMTVFIAPVLNGRRPLALKQPGFGCYACADGRWLSVSVTQEDHLWRKLAEAVDLPGQGPLTTEARAQQYVALRDELARRFAQRPLAQWAAILESRGVPWAPVQTPQEAARDPQLQARGQIVRLATGEWQVCQPLKFDGATPGPSRREPELGEHDAMQIWREPAPHAWTCKEDA